MKSPMITLLSLVLLHTSVSAFSPTDDAKKNNSDQTFAQPRLAAPPAQAVKAPDLVAQYQADGWRLGKANRSRLIAFNAGKKTAYHVVIAAHYPAEMTLVKSSDQWFMRAGGMYTWVIDSLPPGKSHTIALRDSVHPATMPGTVLTVKAMVSAVEGETRTANNMSHYTDAVIVPLPSNVLFTLPEGKSGHNTLWVGRGDTIRYVAHIQNTTDHPVTKVYVQSKVPKGTVLASVETEHHDVQPHIDANGNIRWYLRDLNLSDSASDEAASHLYIRFSVVVQDDAVDMQAIFNRAIIRFDMGKPFQTQGVLQIVAPTAENEPFVTFAEDPLADRSALIAESVHSLIRDMQDLASVRILSPTGDVLDEYWATQQNVPYRGKELYPGVFVLEASDVHGQQYKSRVVVY